MEHTAVSSLPLTENDGSFAFYNKTLENKTITCPMLLGSQTQCDGTNKDIF